MIVDDLADPQESADALFGALCLGALIRHGHLNQGESVVTVDLEKVVADLAELQKQTVIPDTTSAPEWVAALSDQDCSTERQLEMQRLIERMIGDWSIERPEDERGVIFETIYLDITLPARVRYSARSN